MAVLSPELQKAIEENIEQGLIHKRRHPDPSVPFCILNYTSKCARNWKWNPATVICRGLIVSENYTVWSRSFDKFYDLSQLKDFANAIQKDKPMSQALKALPLPPHAALFGADQGHEQQQIPFRISKKWDGSLGVTYWSPVTHRIHIASRGSFDSPQAQWATSFLHAHMSSELSAACFRPSWTYCFEIIFPKGRIVVDYGKAERLVLIGVVETDTGTAVSSTTHMDWLKESIAASFTASVPDQFQKLQAHVHFATQELVLNKSSVTEVLEHLLSAPGQTFTDALETEDQGPRSVDGLREGYVIAWDEKTETNTITHRVKLKLADYLKAHRLCSKNAFQPKEWLALLRSSEMDYDTEKLKAWMENKLDPESETFSQAMAWIQSLETYLHDTEQFMQDLLQQVQAQREAAQLANEPPRTNHGWVQWFNAEIKKQPSSLSSRQKLLCLFMHCVSSSSDPDLPRAKRMGMMLAAFDKDYTTTTTTKTVSLSSFS